jgi:DNA-binding NtrC family response regulator
MKSRSAKILIVDDEPDMCWVVSQIIQSQGLEVVIAYTGEDACLKMANGDFSVVF